jgi:hypothetical protein
MPKNIVATPAAVVAVDRLTLQADDARGDVSCVPLQLCGACTVCFSEE